MSQTLGSEPKQHPENALNRYQQAASFKMPKKNFIPSKLRPWIEARKKYRLSHVQVQMARELGLNPKKLGGIANHRQEQWKAPLPEYIEHLYLRQFGRETPEDSRSIEVKEAEKRRKKLNSKQLKQQANQPPQPVDQTRPTTPAASPPQTALTDSDRDPF